MGTFKKLNLAWSRKKDVRGKYKCVLDFEAGEELDDYITAFYNYMHALQGIQPSDVRKRLSQLLSNVIQTIRKTASARHSRKEDEDEDENEDEDEDRVQDVDSAVQPADSPTDTPSEADAGTHMHASIQLLTHVSVCTYVCFPSAASPVHQRVHNDARYKIPEPVDMVAVKPSANPHAGVKAARGRGGTCVGVTAKKKIKPGDTILSEKDADCFGAGQNLWMQSFTRVDGDGEDKHTINAKCVREGSYSTIICTREAKKTHEIILPFDEFFPNPKQQR